MFRTSRRYLSLWLTCLVGCSPGEKGPRIDLASDRVDLGILEPGEHTFSVKYKNAGREPLRIDKVGSTCSCAQVSSWSEVAPKGMGELRGHVSVKGGPGGADLSVASNEPGGPKIIHVRWFGKSTPTLVADALDVRMKAGESAVRLIELSYPAGDPPKPIALLGVSGLPPGAKVELASDDPTAITSTPGLSASFTVAPSPFTGKATLRVTLPIASASGLTVSNCLVKVGLAGNTFDLPLGITTRVDEGLRVTPERLMFSAGNYEALKKIRRRAVIISEAGDDQIRVVEKPIYLDVALSKSDGNPPTSQLLAQVTAPPPADGTDQRILLEDSSGKRVSVSIMIGLDP